MAWAADMAQEHSSISHQICGMIPTIAPMGPGSSLLPVSRRVRYALVSPCRHGFFLLQHPPRAVPKYTWSCPPQTLRHQPPHRCLALLEELGV